MTLKNDHKGQKKLQNKRRNRRRYRLPAKQDRLFELIDRNTTYYPVGYCWKYKGWMSVGLTDVHNCLGKKCPLFQEGVEGVEG